MNRFSENWQGKAAEWLCLAGIFLLTWRLWLVFNIKASEMLFVAAGIFLVSSLAHAEIHGEGNETFQASWFSKLSFFIYSFEWSFVKPAFFAMAGIVLGAVIGVAYSAIVLPQWASYRLDVLAEFARIFFAFGLFWLVLYLGLRSKTFVSRALTLIVISPLTLWVALVPAWHTLFFGMDERLRGPDADPNYLGSWIGLALLAAAALALWRSGRPGRLGWLAAVLLVPPLLWTSSRGAFIGAFLGFVLLGLHYLIFSKSSRSQKTLSCVRVGVALAIGLVLAFAAAPAGLREAMTARFVAPFLAGPARATVLTGSSLPTIFGNLQYLGAPTVAPGADRWNLVVSGMRLLSVAPLGFGPSFYLWAPVGFDLKAGLLGPHDLYLEVALTAGWLGFLAFMYLMWLIARRLAILWRTASWQSGALFGMLVSLFIVSFSLDMLTLRWLWIPVALAVAYAAHAAAGRNEIV